MPCLMLDVDAMLDAWGHRKFLDAWCDADALCQIWAGVQIGARQVIGSSAAPNVDYANQLFMAWTRFLRIS